MASRLHPQGISSFIVCISRPVLMSHMHSIKDRGIVNALRRRPSFDCPDEIWNDISPNSLEYAESIADDSLYRTVLRHMQCRVVYMVIHIINIGANIVVIYV